jgi:hypothetical protein
MLAIIGDGHNNAGSLAIHKKFGFSVAGQLRSVGYKMGDWRDTLIMQRALGDGDWTLPDIRRQIPARGVNAAGLPLRGSGEASAAIPGLTAALAVADKALYARNPARIKWG